MSSHNHVKKDALVWLHVRFTDEKKRGIAFSHLFASAKLKSFIRLKTEYGYPITSLILPDTSFQSAC